METNHKKLVATVSKGLLVEIHSLFERKTGKDFALRQEEINIRKHETHIAKSKEEASQKQIAQLIENSQQQTNKLVMLITKMIEKR